MAIFSKKQLLLAAPSQISQIAESVRNEFEADGYEINVDTLMSGGYDISITKGGLFKAVLGMRTALKITLTPLTDGILFHADVGIFGQQAIPTVISMFLFWPVLLTQLWGLIQQSSLDDRALSAAQRVIIKNSESDTVVSKQLYCTACGHKVVALAKFCSKCGANI